MVCTARGRPDEALGWLVRAAEQRADPSVPYDLGRFLLEGTLSARHVDRKLGRKHMQQAAEMGYAAAQTAMSRLVLCDDPGDGARAGPGKEHVAWARHAAEQGDSEAAKLLARHHMRGGEMLELVRLALRWCTQYSMLARLLTSSKVKS